MLLYFLFWKKNITPGEFYRMPPGERLLLTAFYQKELEGQNKPWLSHTVGTTKKRRAVSRIV